MNQRIRATANITLKTNKKGCDKVLVFGRIYAVQSVTYNQSHTHLDIEWLDGCESKQVSLKDVELFGDNIDVRTPRATLSNLVEEEAKETFDPFEEKE